MGEPVTDREPGERLKTGENGGEIRPPETWGERPERGRGGGTSGNCGNVGRGPFVKLVIGARRNVVWLVD